MKSLRMVAALSILTGSCFFMAHLGAATIAEVMGKIQSRRRAADFKAEGRLIRADASGQGASYHISLKGKSFAGTIKILCEVTDPPPARLKLLMEAPAKGKLTMRLAKERDGKAIELLPERWGDAFLESGFAYEDFIDAYFSWSQQTLVREEKYGVRDCFVIGSQPGADEGSHYSMVTSWIDREIYFPVFVQKRVRESGVIKEFVYRGLRQSRGVWGAAEVEVRIKDNPLRTLLSMTRGSAKANLTEADFDPRVLISPRGRKSN